MKAQYEVLGIGIQKGGPSRPVRHSQNDEGGTGRSMAAYAREAACGRPGVEHFYRPWPRRLSGLGRTISFFRHFPALRTALLSLVPPGLILEYCQV
jgi:hypothetical protein